MTLVMLYRTIVKPEAVAQLNKVRNEFSDIYSEHGIEVLGHWKNAENPSETIYMVKYESESDYQNKIEELHESERYIHLTAKLNSIRTDFRSEKLVPA